MKFLAELESDDPILSVVNLIDIFLVVIAALLIGMASNPLVQAMTSQDITIIKDAGQENMEIIIKKGEQIEHFKSTGESGLGEGTKAGVAYKMKDGSVVYVPESNESK